MWYRYFVILIVVSTILVQCAEWHYHNNSELEAFLRNFTKLSKSHIRSRLYSIGKSQSKNNLWVIELTAAKKEKLGVPNIKFIGTVHGNEPVGRELLLHFMEYLYNNYNIDLEVTWLLDNAKIHFLPNLNPDGFALSGENMCSGEYGRNNGLKGKDLNRNFPDFYHRNRIPVEPETIAVKKWLRDVPFILSAALHSGALVVNYPFDTAKEITSEPRNPPSLTADNDVFVHLAKVYAQNHLTMHKGESCGEFQFDGGITNGAAWYTVIGGMQDYNYAFHGCMELTLEISCCKYPSAKELPTLWEQNKMALLKYSLEALKGVTGQVIDGYTLKPIHNASLQISGRNVTFFTAITGEFWRLLLPGKYQLEISAEGYYNQVVPFAVKEYNNSMPQLTNLTIRMTNMSVSTTSTTTPLQKATETTTRFVEATSDGASVRILPRSFESEDQTEEIKPTPASLSDNFAENSAVKIHIQFFIYSVIFLTVVM